MYYAPPFFRVVPFAIYLVFLAVAPLALSLQNGHIIPLALDLRWLYGAKVVVVSMALLMYWPRFVELAGVARARSGDWLLAVLVGALVFVVWIHLDVSWAMFGTPDGFDPRDDEGRIDWGLVSVRIFGAAIVVPLMEELFWRSFVMRWIDQQDFLSLSPAATSVRALVMSSLLFGLEHHLWLAGILAGLAYGWLYMRTGKLWIAVVSHGVTNALLGVWVVRTGNWQFW